VLKERVVELYSYLAASVLVFCYVFYQFFDNQPHTKDWQASKSVRLARLILMAVLEPATLFFAIYVARSFGWVSFVTMGVNSQLQRTYRTYTVFMGLLKINCQILLSIIFIGFFSKEISLAVELLIESLALCLTVTWFAVAHLAFTHESPKLVLVHAVLSLIQPAYIVWKMMELTAGNKFDDFTTTPILFLGSLGLILYFVVMACSLLVYRNFGKGLYEKLHET